MKNTFSRIEQPAIELWPRYWGASWHCPMYTWWYGMGHIPFSSGGVGEENRLWVFWSNFYWKMASVACLPICSSAGPQEALQTPWPCLSPSVSRRDSTRLREFTFMVTHQSANFTFSTYLHFMTKGLLALLYISSNLADHSVTKACSAAPITLIRVGSVIVKSPLFAPLELWWPELGFGQDRPKWSRKKQVSLNWDVAMAVHPHR